MSESLLTKDQSNKGSAQQKQHRALELKRWKAEIAAASDLEKCREIELKLAAKPENFKLELGWLLSEKIDQLLTDQPDGGEVKEPVISPSLEWVSGTLRQVLAAVERVKQGEAGTWGVIPLGCLRDGGRNLTQHRVLMKDRLKGNRAAIFAQSGMGKTNLVKVVLFWLIFNPTYGKLILDYKGEYVPWTLNERGEEVPGLCEHPLAKERVVLYTTKERHLNNANLNAQVSVRQLKVNLQSILPRDLALFWPNLTPAQQEFLFTYDEEAWIYEVVLGEEKGWYKLGTWFGEAAAKAVEEDGKALDGVGKRVIRSIRKKLQATQKRFYVVSNPVRLEEGANRRLVLSTPYHKDFVEALKETIPSAYRRWEDETKTWNIAQEYRVSLLRLLNRYFGAVGESDSLSLIGQDLAEGNLVVLDLSGIAGETDRDLVATLITRRQFEYNLERSDLSESSEKGGLVPFVAFFEEAQNLLSTDKMQAGRDPTFVRLFKEGRGLSIGTTSITQQPGALARSLTSQIAYYVVQHLRSSEDIQNLTEMDGALEGTERDIARRIPGNALMVDNERGFALPLKVDRFDREYVEAVKLAYQELEAEEQKPSTNIGLSGY